MAQNIAHSQRTTLSSPSLVLRATFPTMPTHRLPLLFSLPLPLQQQSCSLLLSVLSPSVTLPPSVSVKLQKLFYPSQKIVCAIPVSSPQQSHQSSQDTLWTQKKIDSARYKEGFYMMRGMKHWHWLLREVMDAPSLATFRPQAGWGFKHPGVVEGVPPQGRGLD